MCVCVCVSCLHPRRSPWAFPPTVVNECLCGFSLCLTSIISHNHWQRFIKNKNNFQKQAQIKMPQFIKHLLVLIVFAPPGQFLVLSLKEVNRSWCCCTLPSISWSFAMLTEQIQTKRPWVQFTETCISEREHQCKWCWCSSPNKLFYLYSCRDPNIDVIFVHRLFSFCFYYNCCCQACCDTHTQTVSFSLNMWK